MIYSVYTVWNFDTQYVARFSAGYNILRIVNVPDKGRQRTMSNETRLVLTDKGVKSLIAGFVLLAVSVLIMVGATIAAQFMQLDKAWRIVLVIAYTVPGIAGIALIGRAYATSKRVPETIETASGITERESK